MDVVEAVIISKLSVVEPNDFVVMEPWRLSGFDPTIVLSLSWSVSWPLSALTSELSAKSNLVSDSSISL
ncbi:hypothetical protein BpHYR1_020517 [Brachionus plicatilis]|uniref:Uncharacterized protein n=1 Tax=Brachionus plicatilis TaxID=10195 RepID=A0A3M7QP21_BRAPC|nr:hypothetical protein BpHYR1_020517 [Brachionus plicatilis]